MARSGLRMMPTFPSPSLKFRTVSFPQYGFKVGLSDGAFPNHAQYHVVQFASVLRALRFRRRTPRTVPRDAVRLSTSVRAAFAALSGSYPGHPGFYFQASGELVTLLAAGYNYDSPWTVLSVGLAPTGMTSSLAALQPFLDEPHDASVRNPMLDELHQPFVGKTIEKAANVHIEHPVHVLRQQSGVERIQRIMLASPRPESVRETQKVGFVDSVQHLDGRTLDDLVLQHGNSERPLPPIRL